MIEKTTKSYRDLRDIYIKLGEEMDLILPSRVKMRKMLKEMLECIEL